MSQGDQTEVVEFLCSQVSTVDGRAYAGRTYAGRTYAGRTEDRMVETHISIIVMRGPLVWKLKRAIRLPYLDFSTPALRAAACEQEVALNRRTAPAIYLGVRRITRAANGKLEFDGKGELVDAVVEMQRFDDSTLFSQLAQDGALERDMLTTLARHIAGFHAQANVHVIASGSAAIEAVLSLNEQNQDMAPVLGAHVVQQLRAALRTALHQHRTLLDQRAATGRVRRCHGDLHLRNICLFEGRPTLFDCIEFNDSIAVIDVLYDLAFLLMDLWQVGLKAEANWVMNRYMDEADEAGGLPLLPFFMALRASIRAQVLATQAALPQVPQREEVVAQAKAYMALAMQLLQPLHISMVAIGGLSGSGKSTVAAAIAHCVGTAPGARILATDRVRKYMAGVSPETRLPSSSYTKESSAQVYAALYEQAEQILAGGYSVIADGVFSRQEERARIKQCAVRAGVPFRGIWLEAKPDTLIARVEARTGDPSDAGKVAVLAQLQRQAALVEWETIPAGGTSQATAQNVLARLGAAPSLT